MDSWGIYTLFVLVYLFTLLVNLKRLPLRKQWSYNSCNIMETKTIGLMSHQSQKSRLSNLACIKMIALFNRASLFLILASCWTVFCDMIYVVVCFVFISFSEKQNVWMGYCVKFKIYHEHIIHICDNSSCTFSLYLVPNPELKP